MSDFNAVAAGSSGPLSYSPIMSPTLSSYAGLSGDELIGLADLQGSYQPQIPAGDLAQANQYVQAASQATDPNLQLALLNQAIAVLTRGGQPAAQPVAQPVSQPTAASPSSAPAASTGTGTGVDSSATPLSVNGNSVNTGMYTITASSKDDGSLTITNNQTGQSTEVWGDPHIKVNGQDVADFQKGPLNIQLQDGTVVHIDPTQLQNGVAHIGQVSITKGDHAVTMGGTGSNGSFAGGVNTSQVMNGIGSYQSSLYNAPNATDITLGADGNLYFNNANGSMGQEITAPSGGGETDLDGHGGGLIGQPSAGGSDPTANGTGQGAGSIQQAVQMITGLLANSQFSFNAMMMQQTLSQLESHSGYAQSA